MSQAATAAALRGPRRRSVVTPAPLLVIPNPYAALDFQGRPAAAARLDPDPQHSAGRRIYIGAKIGAIEPYAKRLSAANFAGRPATEARPAKLGRPAVPAKPAVMGLSDVIHVHFWEFIVDEPTSIADTPHHRQIVQHSSVFPADEGTHKRVFGASKPFVPPADALQKSRQAAIDNWKATYGVEPIFVQEEAEIEKELAAQTSTSAAPAAPTPHHPTTT